MLATFGAQTPVFSNPGVWIKCYIEAMRWDGVLIPPRAWALRARTQGHRPLIARTANNILRDLNFCCHWWCIENATTVRSWGIITLLAGPLCSVRNDSGNSPRDPWSVLSSLRLSRIEIKLCVIQLYQSVWACCREDLAAGSGPSLHIVQTINTTNILRSIQFNQDWGRAILRFSNEYWGLS